MAKKKIKYFINVSLNTILHLFPVWEAQFCKKVKIIVPYWLNLAPIDHSLILEVNI